MALTKVGRSLLNTGVADSSDATAITISSAEDATFAGHVLLADSKNIKIGAGTDLQLYHDGSNSYITNSTGALKIATETSGIAVTIGHTTSETTIADNLTVTGTIASAVITADGLDMGDSEKIRLGASQDLEIYHDGSHSYVYDGGTGNIVLKTNNGAEVDVMGGSEYMAKFIKDGAVELYYDDSKKIETTSAGATVTGTLTATLSGNVTGNLTGQVSTGAQTGITSILNTSLVLGRDSDNDIDFATDNKIIFRAAAADQVTIEDGIIAPVTNNDIDLGSDSLEFKDAYFDGTVELDNLTVGGAQGSDGEVLTSTGSGVGWEAVSGGPTNKTFGTDSIMVGDSTTGTINAANYNTALGVDAFNAITEGDFNTAVGWGAGKGITTGHRGTFIGAGTGYQNAVTADGNTCIGNEAGHYINTGASNTFVGYGAGKVVVSGGENVAIGKDAYLAGTASNNVVMGADAMKSTTSGTQQVAVGKAAMQSNTTGNYNTAFGAYAGQDNGEGSNNTYIGYQAGKDINYTSGEQASENTFVGYQAGHQLTTPSRGTYVGRGAGGNMIQGPTHQTAVGMYSLYGHYGTYSTGVGYGCYQTGSGAYLAGLGYGHSCTGASSIHIGYNISDNTSNQINMGGGSTYITCDYSSGSSWSGGSDERMKKDITTDTLGLSFINDLRPVTFKWKAPSEFPTSWETYSPPTYVNSLGDTIEQETEPQSTDTVHGLVAQEVKTALDTAGVSTFSGWSERDGGQQCISKEMFVIPLINAVNELTTRLEAAEAKITALESE